MKFFQKTFFLLFVLISILTAHILAINLLPFPYNRLNIVFSLLTFLLITRQSPQIIWLAFVLSYFLQLLSGVPFGITQASIIIALLLTNWFQLSILTNRSPYIIFILTFLGIVFYRLLFFTFLTAYNYFTRNSLMSGQISTDIAWEALFSASTVYILYIVYSKFTKTSRRNFRTDY